MNDSFLDAVHMQKICIFLESIIRYNINLKVDIYCNIIFDDYHLAPIHTIDSKTYLIDLSEHTRFLVMINQI